MANEDVYPVVDLFAGPGGLGEGFASLRHPKDRNRYIFRTAISIEKDPHAHRTLQLRHFYRSFLPDNVHEDYYRYLEGSIGLEELYKRHTQEHLQAQQTAWLCVLGEEPHANVKGRIARALADHHKWVLVGGPPCQAYSKAGRSRMKGNPEFESDPRHFLYIEYLRILADHKPPVFVMENVKGLLSSKIKGDYVIRRILQDLISPGHAIYGDADGLEYRLYALSDSGRKNISTDPAAFIVKAEEYGIPQARHRIFIVGIRSDLDVVPYPLKKGRYCTVMDAIGDLPALRSSISRSPDSDVLWVQTLREIMYEPWFARICENGLAGFREIAEEILVSLAGRKFQKSDISYSAPRIYADWFSDSRLNVLLSHESRSHMKSDLHRYFFAAVYARINHATPKLQDFPQELLPDHKNAEMGTSEYIFADRFRVQLPNAPATTITSHILKDGHYYIHYDPAQCRSLTVREAARLQTFPDNYRFEGPRTEQYRQVGNAVPPLLANKIAEIVYEVLEAMD